MKTITLVQFIGLAFFARPVFSQTAQSFVKDKFVIVCNCKLNPNTKFVNMAREYGSPYPTSAYVCALNEENYDKGTIHNITIQDLSADYKSYKSVSPSESAYLFEKLFLDKYRKNLLANGITANYTTYRGVKAIRYSFIQMETMPAEAILFVKNKKSYLLQVSSRYKVGSKFQLFSGTFHFINY